MPDKVYALYYWNVEGEYIKSLWSSERKALAAREKLPDDTAFNGYTIEELFLDTGDDTP